MSKRWIQQAYAKANGYFWLPCPCCGEPFGGHEWGDVQGLPSIVPDPDRLGSWWGICPTCTAQGFGYEQHTIESGPEKLEN